MIATPAPVGTPPPRLPAGAAAATDRVLLAELGLALWRESDRLMAALGDGEPVPVRVLLARPVTDPEGPLALMTAARRCLAELPGLAALPAGAQELLGSAIRERYCVATIEAVLATEVAFGNRYWRVRTDRGERAFLLRDPQRHVLRVAPDQVWIRDTLGNRYRIASLAALDPSSRAAAEHGL